MRLLQTAEPLPDRLVIDASAGTGKTWSVVALIARELALREDLRIGNLLITTFTRNAAAELRDRLRKRLASSAQGLKSDGTGDLDPLNSMLRNATDAERLNRAQRLERALTEFDSASISTIHGICSRILRAAGREIGSIAEASTTDRITSEVINDLLVTHAASAGRWDEKRLRLVVAQLLGDPYLQPWFDANDSELKEQDRLALTGLIELLGTAVSRIQAAMRDTPDYNDVLRLAWQLLRDPAQAAVLAILKQRFRLAIVDEAQDTNRIQWELFEQLFPGGDGRSLVSVGDPKQAIYGFRGADVKAYVEFTGTTTSRYSLDVNRRSDQPLLTQLNDVMANHEFGTGIQYVAVHAPAERQTSLIEGTAAPLEFIGVEGGSNQTKLIRPAVGKVQQLLEWGRILPIGVSENAGAQHSRAVEPSDICILVRSNGVGRLVQRGLSRVGIPSVTGGTSSVMRSAMALEIRTLLDAMERPPSTGRVRRVAATVFFGHPMASVGVLTDEQIEAIQSRLMHYSGVLTKKGLAALSTTIESDESVMMRMVAGKQGERNLTDFMHLLEVMDSHSPGRGCTAEKALQIYGQLDELDDKDELVSRRVESDADAVRILTIHAAKGLQFPCVLVADLWKGTRDRGKTIVFYDRDGGRKIDIGTAVRTADGYAGSEYAKECWLAAQDEELKRLIYVAATRAEHWLGVLVPTVDGQSLDDSILAQTMTLPGSPAELGVVPDPMTRTFGSGERAPAGLRTADLSTVQETWRKQSFTGITAAFRGGRYEPLQENGSGHDEVTLKPEDDFSENPGLGGSSEVIELPAGTAVGTVVHEIFEHVDTSRRPLRDEVARVVNERVTGGRLRGFQDRLISCITDSLETPLGAHLGELTLAEIGPADRLSELRFDMSLMSLADGIRACDLGSKLLVCLKPEDSLFAYAETLARPEFNVPLGGLLNGSIDAVLRLPGSSPLSPRLLIVDYKSNKLHQAEDRNPLAAYAPGKLATAMAKSHYPLQALLYGVALYRFLRWRAPAVDPDQALAGFVYGFIRGMRGPNTPSDSFGNRYGVFAWQAPAGLWSELSQFLASPAFAGANR